MSNEDNDLVGLIDETEKDMLQEAPEDPVAAFDVTAGVRREALENAATGLLRASDLLEEGKTEEAAVEVSNALVRTHTAVAALNELINTIMHDMVKIIRAVANSEANTMTMTAKVSTLLATMTTKGLATEEEMVDIYQKEVLPAIEAQMKEAQKEAEGN